MAFPGAVVRRGRGRRQKRCHIEPCTQTRHPFPCTSSPRKHQATVLRTVVPLVSRAHKKLFPAHSIPTRNHPRRAYTVHIAAQPTHCVYPVIRARLHKDITGPRNKNVRDPPAIDNLILSGPAIGTRSQRTPSSFTFPTAVADGGGRSYSHPRR
jgi:hypothetical protein